MKLGHDKNDFDLSSSYLIDDNALKQDLRFLNEELRTVEDKFYKIFDLNPCPMAISKLGTAEIIDVNESFVKIVGLKSKYDVIGKLTTEEGVRIIKETDRKRVLKMVEENGFVKNIFIKFRTPSGKKYKGLFSATIIELNKIKCLFTICQIINKRCLIDYFTCF